jgi:hypothetical protein
LLVWEYSKGCNAMNMPSKGLRPSALVSGLCGWVLIASAGSAIASEQWVTDNVKYVYPQPDGSFVISFVNPQPICTSTATPQYFTVQAGANGMTADGVKVMFATALTALATDKQIQLAFEASTASCYVNRLRIVGGS